ncbi:integrase [Enterococcus faecalis EnGen0281]|nr:integrase [Enterococcus faecalis EnGen0281]
MTYKHLTIDELTMIESYYLQHNKPVEIANRMGRAIQTIYNVVNKFKQGKTALDYWHQYKENKKKCGRKVIQLPAHEVDYIKEKVTLGWTPDVIIGRKENPMAIRKNGENNNISAQSMIDLIIILISILSLVTLKVIRSLAFIIKVPSLL